ncbi:MAG: hypothetical protein WCW13_03310 [archaeon]|jgi:tRNA G46 methylase TrmB
MPRIHPFEKAKKIVTAFPPQIRAIDFGAGNAEWIKQQAKRHPTEVHVAVDTDYLHNAKVLREARKSRKNTIILPAQSEDVVEMMLKRGKKTRFAVVRMPIPGYVVSGRDITGLDKIISQARNLLTTNGTLLITTESEKVEKYLVNLAKENRLVIRKRALTIPRTEWEKRRMSEGATIKLYTLKTK